MSMSTLTHDQTLSAIEKRATASFAALMLAFRDRIDAVLSDLGVEGDTCEGSCKGACCRIGAVADQMLADLEKPLGQFVCDEVTIAFPNLDASECDGVNVLCDELAATPVKLARRARAKSWQPKNQ